MLAERPRNGEIRVARARLRPVTLAALPFRLLVPVSDHAHDGDLHPGPRQADQRRTPAAKATRPADELPLRSALLYFDALRGMQEAGPKIGTAAELGALGGTRTLNLLTRKMEISWACGSGPWPSGRSGLRGRYVSGGLDRACSA